MKSIISRETEGLTARALALALLAVCLIAPAGCSGDSGPLEGTRWRLTGWTISSLWPGDFVITAQFADGKITGSTGLNTYGGPCKVGSGGKFAAGPLAVTLKAGPEPDMRAERVHLQLLGAAKSYKIAGNKLTLYDQGGFDSVYFEAVTK